MKAGWGVAALVLFAALMAALPPLHEMDLAQHLATGEWIVRHGRVPFVEPFAWTREGQPYFAYSWLPQATYYLLLRAFGPVGLHVLQGAIAGSAVYAAAWAARQFGWSAPVQLCMGALQLLLLWGVANTIRPQQFLFIAVPLAWGLAARIHARGIGVRRLLALAAVGALAANSHIFFPLTAVPLAWFLLHAALERRPEAVVPAGRWLLPVAALAVGWLLSPYALAWHRVFALNFGDNILLRRPPSIKEFVPGVEYALERTGVVVVALVLLAAPWLRSAQRWRERVLRALFWTAGLLLFAYAGRLVLAWWTLSFALVGSALDASAGVALRRVRGRAAALAAAGLAAVLLFAAAPPVVPAFWRFEGDTVHRMLPRGGEDPALWLPSWLLCHTRPGARGRLFTEFNYGSELTWRLPGFSPSIDGRTIFPDSVAVDFSFQPYGRQGGHASTWTHADVALLDHTFWAVPAIAQDPAWVLLAHSRQTSWGSLGTLWAKRSWWQEWGTTTELPAAELRPGDPRGTCAATGEFPR